MLTLYSYFRSSAAFRVRIALALKGLDYDTVAVHLLKNGGEQHHSDFLSINPYGLLPALRIEDDSEDVRVLTQSLAILEYLEEEYPQAPLLPDTAYERAQVRGLALAVACDIHPLNNLRVTQYLKSELNISDNAKQAWYTQWIERGFAAIEHELSTRDAKRFCFGEQVSLADVCLIPQVYNARRFDCHPERFRHITSVYEHCMSMPAFQHAAPESQPDAA